jgi:hypothetical protein
MDTSTKTKAARRKYQRRTDEQRIADLEKRIADLKARAAEREKKTDPVIREIPKVQRRLRKFAQLAMERKRPDIANTTTAFAAALERILRSELGQSKDRNASLQDQEEE